ncbi:MAG: T9SS type A sorting domain-containing protein [Bacteroidia bacterium]
MRKVLFAFYTLFAALGSNAQDTVVIKKHLFPKLGYELPVANAQLHPDSFGYLQPQAQQHSSYNLVNIEPYGYDIDKFKAPKELEGGGSVSNAQYGFEYRYGSGFFKNEGDSMLLVAFTPNLNLQFPLTFQFDSPVVFMQTPMQVGQSYTDSTTSLLQIPFFYNINAKMTNSFEAFDENTMHFKDTSLTVIRVRRELVFYAIANDLLNNTIDTLADTLVTWEFYAQGFKSTVLRAEYQLIPTDTINFDTLLLLTYYNDPTVSKPNTIDLSSVKIQQFGNQLVINSDVSTQVRLVSLNGAQLIPFGISQSNHQIDLNALPKGVFIVQVQSKSGYTSQVLVR